MKIGNIAHLLAGSILLLGSLQPARAANLTRALSLDGSTQYARLAASQAVLNNVGYMTAEVWFKTSVAKDQSPISHYRRGSNDCGWYLALLANGTTVQLRWQASQSQVSHAFTLPARYDNGQWHHLAFSAGEAKVEVFYDGQSLGTQATEGRLVPPSTVFAIGVRYADGTRAWYFNGELAEVRFWRGARTAAQIAANYNRRLFGNEAGLLGYWPLNNIVGTTAADLSPSVFPATLYGGAAQVATALPLSTLVVADATTASRGWIHDSPASVVRFPAPPDYDLYAVTTTNVPPTGGWVSTSSPPATLAFALPETPGPVTFYAWFTNSAAAVPSYLDACTINYLDSAAVTAAGTGGGQVARTPDALDDRYDLGTALSLTAQAEAGHHFLYWQGDLPPGAYPTNNPLTFRVDQTRSLTAVFTADTAPVRIWSGKGANALASNTANWQGGAAPQSGNSVFFGFTPTGARTDCTWDLNIAVSNWTQTAVFPGAITFLTVYAGAFSNLTLTGNVVVEGGKWTHPVNNDAPVNRLALSVGGSFNLGTNAMIDLRGRGYASYKGPANGASTGARSGKAAGHGGMQATSISYLPAACYGDAAIPLLPGSGGVSPGGGVLDLTVAGTAVVDGIIDVEGEPRSGSDQDVYNGAAGGSILLRAAAIAGSGRLTARGAIGYYAGAGGRVSLTVTNTASLDPLLRPSTAAGQNAWAARSSGGSRYLKTTAFERLIYDAQNLAAQTGVATEMPALGQDYAVNPAVGGPMENATLILTNGATVRLPRYLRLGDFARITATSKLDLNSYSLFIKADEPPGAFPADYGNGLIVSNGGAIVWGDATASFDLIIEPSPDGSVAIAPESPDGAYEISTPVTLTANPDPGNHFIWWQGTMPDGVSRDTNPLELVMEQRYVLRPIFATNDAAVCTWTGEGADDFASTPTNWHPIAAPTSGKHILFNAISDKRCAWNLDIRPASWRQTADYVSFWSLAEGYRGWVDFLMRHPGFGTFTNLTIDGDVDLQGGTWSHDFNDAGHVETDRIWITVKGDFTLGTTAEINMNRRAGSGGYDILSRGFANSSGYSPGHGGTRETVQFSASYGGRGGYLAGYAPRSCYGSFSAPQNHGSSGLRGAGGGSIRLEVTGTAAIAGLIDVGTDSDSRHSGGAGGSIWLTAADLTGVGRLHATGGVGYLGGGGGRIAVILTASEAFPSLDMRAWGGRNRGGEAGTIYLRDAQGRQRLIVDNNGYTADPLVNYTELYDDGLTDFANVELEIRNGGRVGIQGNVLRIKNLTMTANSKLYLLGKTVVVRSPMPRVPLAGTVVTDGGALVWTPAGTVLLIR